MLIVSCPHAVTALALYPGTRSRGTSVSLVKVTMLTEHIETYLGQVDQHVS
jgi:hypothetical protein